MLVGIELERDMLISVDIGKTTRTHPSGQVNARMELLSTKALESLDTKLETGIHQLDVGPLSKRIVYDRLVLVNGDGTCRVNDVAAR